MSVFSNGTERFQTVSPIRQTVPSTFEERFTRLESMVTQLGLALARPPRAAPAPPLESPESHRKSAQLGLIKAILDERRVITMADLRKELGVSLKSAHRLSRDMVHRGAAQLLFESAGPTERLVLFHNDQVVVDDPRKRG